MNVVAPIAVKGVEESVALAAATERVGLEQYYSEAGPDYGAWSRGFNMHFRWYRWGMNPFRREAMLEQMNVEVLRRLRIESVPDACVADLGCGLGATMRAIAKRRTDAQLTGLTLVPWQVEQTQALNSAAGISERVSLALGDYEDSGLAAESFDAAYALESSCYAHGADKERFLREAYRLLRPHGRLVIVDGFLRGTAPPEGLRGRIYRKLCECWVVEEFGSLELVVAAMRRVGFQDVHVECVQYRVVPSGMHIPWVTLKFLMTEVVFGSRKMTKARWNNVIAPVLAPLVGYPGGPMTYCVIRATKR